MKTFAKICLLVLVSATAGGRAAESSQSFQVKAAADPAIKMQADAVLPRLLDACPGLSRYSEDFTQAEVSHTSMREYKGGIELTFSVAARPNVLPKPLSVYSAGNTCVVSINAAASKAYIGKRACHSICSGTWQENSPGLLGREFRLK